MQELHPAIVTLVDELREPHECIWDWHRDRSGEISVRLIDEREITKVRQAEEMLGLSWGKGRVLNFTEIAGQWSFQSQGTWIA